MMEDKQKHYWGFEGVLSDLSKRSSPHQQIIFPLWVQESVIIEPFQIDTINLYILIPHLLSQKWVTMDAMHYYIKAK